MYAAQHAIMCHSTSILSKRVHRLHQASDIKYACKMMFSPQHAIIAEWTPVYTSKVDRLILTASSYCHLHSLSCYIICLPTSLRPPINSSIF
jgi:hypothetical protein